ncbi:MAG TPA: discoidin domain-containing protein [Armatimonadota bacterium]|nr:discoidin domain-containing protein [Armatimonadota bacterium]
MLALLIAASPGWAAPNPDLPSAEVSELYLDCLEEFERYAESVWHDAPALDGGGYFGDGASGGNGGIRGTCGIALAYATLYRAGRGSADDQERRLGRVRSALWYAAETHSSGGATCVDGKKWGGGWQTGLWTGSLGFAAAIMGEELEPNLRAACKRVVRAEADSRVGIPPASGHVGDSKAEENAWNSNAPALAAAWLADHPRAGEWMAGAKRYLANTYTVPDDASGKLASWVTTTTLYPSFACENHGFFHPSYQMVSGMSLGDSLVMARVLNQAVASELKPFAEHHVMDAWKCLRRVVLDSGELAYPSGLDWSLHGYGQISYYAWLATHFNDATARRAESLLAQHIAARQRVNGDGRFTGEGVPNGFYTEAVKARRVAMAWWHHQVADHADGPRWRPAPFVHQMADVGLILQRGERGYVSVSYGQRTMALVIPESLSRPGEPHVVTPRFPSVIGDGLFGRPGKTELASFEVRREGFEAELMVSHGPLERMAVKLLSTGDALAVIQVPLPAVTMSGGSPAAFPLGIENHALTGGSRTVTSAGGDQTLAAMSGTRADDLGSWACVSERLGYVVGPDAQVGYHAATGYNRRGAAEDSLHAMPADPIAPRYAIILPAATASETAAVERSVVWRDADGKLELSFDAPATGRHAVVMDRPRADDRGLRAMSATAVTGSSSYSEKHGPDLAADGDVETFWCSSRDGALSGHGPTPEQPEWLDFGNAGEAISEIIIVPRPKYGPRAASLEVDGVQVWQGEMTHEPLRIELPEPVSGDTLRLVMTSSHDPRYPDAPRNVQVSEVILLTQVDGEH